MSFKRLKRGGRLAHAGTRRDQAVEQDTICVRGPCLSMQLDIEAFKAIEDAAGPQEAGDKRGGGRMSAAQRWLGLATETETIACPLLTIRIRWEYPRVIFAEHRRVRVETERTFPSHKAG